MLLPKVLTTHMSSIYFGDTMVPIIVSLGGSIGFRDWGLGFSSILLGDTMVRNIE